MPNDDRTPAREPPLLAFEHGGFFEVYRDPPRHVIGEVDGTVYAVVYDGQPRPRLTIDFDGRRTKIDVETGTVVEGGMAEDELANALEYAKACAGELASVWQDMHDAAERLRQELETLAGGLTDPGDLELDEENPTQA